MNRKHSLVVFGVVLALLAGVAGTSAQSQRPQDVLGTVASAPLSTSFTYQGQLKNASGPMNGNCDFQFSLWDSAGDSTGQIGTTQAINNVTVSGGLFTVALDFGTSAFTGDARWLQIEVRCPAGSGTYVVLTQRQPLTAAPYALYAPASGSTNALLGRAISTTAPVSGQILKWNSGAWSPSDDENTTYTAGDGLELTGTQFKAKGTPYQNVVIVAKSGGDYTAVQAALDSITTASDTNRYLVWVAPGVYTETVTMKPYVDIEGAGELLTTISYTGSASFTTGTVIGANNAELRLLTVRSTGGNTSAMAIYNSSASPRLTHITAFASGGSTYNYGVHNRNSSSPAMTDVTASGSGGSANYGVANSYSSPTMTNVTASASGDTGSYNTGVRNDSSSPTMANVTASASGGSRNNGVYNDSSSPTMTNMAASASGGSTSNYGVYNFASSVKIQNSIVRASGETSGNYGIFNSAASGSYTVTINNCQITGSTTTISNDTEFTVRIGASQLDGGNIALNGGTVTCAGVYDENYTFYASTCP